MHEIEKLKAEIISLKNKYKSKSEKLKKTNSDYTRILKRLNSHNRSWNAIEEELSILKQLTSHLDIYYYKVEYKYKDRIYHEQKIESYGYRWIKPSLVIFLNRQRDVMVYSWEIEIKDVKKLE